jgi:hypothetical protein
LDGRVSDILAHLLPRDAATTVAIETIEVLVDEFEDINVSSRAGRASATKNLACGRIEGMDAVHPRTLIQAGEQGVTTVCQDR